MQEMVSDWETGPSLTEGMCELMMDYLMTWVFSG